MSMKATGKIDENTVIELDLSDLKKDIDKRFVDVEKKIESIQKPESAEGRGVVEFYGGKDKTKLIEQLRNIRNADIREQWTVAIPAVTTAEVAAHLRNYVYVTDVIKGQPGDVVNVPYVKDFDFETLSSVGDAFSTQTTGIVNTTTTTLKEAGAWSDIAYEDIEKIDQNLLDEINRTFAHAAVRAEDKNLIEAVSAQTASGLAGEVGDATNTYIFRSRWVTEAIGKLLLAGKDVAPGDLVLYMTARPYAALLTELAASQVIAYARGDVITRGIVEDYLGVRIVVGGEVEYVNRTGTNETCAAAYLMRGRRALVLAPKRDILIETDRQIATRKLRITGSHTFGVKLIDATEVVRIRTNTSSGAYA